MCGRGNNLLLPRSSFEGRTQPACRARRPSHRSLQPVQHCMQPARPCYLVVLWGLLSSIDDGLIRPLRAVFRADGQATGISNNAGAAHG